MATKNLARTVIEGGRSRFNKAERRHSNRRARRKVRQYTHDLCRDLEGAESRVAPERRRVPRVHDDKLAPAGRWLASFVGRPWQDARAEIARRFDTRTIAGQHIVFDHLLAAIDPQRRGLRRGAFFVDGGGILRRAPASRSRRRVPPGKVRRSWREIEMWARDRLVGRRGSAWFWFEPVGWDFAPCWMPRCWRDHIERRGKRGHLEPNGRYRQGAALTPDEVRYWDQLLERVQRELAFPGNRRGKGLFWLLEPC